MLLKPKPHETKPMNSKSHTILENYVAPEIDSMCANERIFSIIFVGGKHGKQRQGGTHWILPGPDLP